jgi:hypothetical protein
MKSVLDFLVVGTKYPAAFIMSTFFWSKSRKVFRSVLIGFAVWFVCRVVLLAFVPSLAA